jgi:quercetin dioxygenase-like cupin family protein
MIAGRRCHLIPKERPSMELITPSKTAKASDSAFTGDVYVNPIKQKAEPSRLIASIVRFIPGARTNWHSHALGQTLFCTDGAGLVVSRDGTVLRLTPATPSGLRPAKSTGTAPASTA